uniref:Coiled-coil domain containing 158 n=1 Tax=Poecilia formosa TaxID=48698 RepID=A0A096LWK7_POEFO
MSNSKPPGPQKPHVGTDSYFLTFGDSPVANDAADRVTQSASLSLRFNRTLDELSEELNRQTMEIQDIREEIQNAPSGALRRFGSPYRNRSPERSCHKIKIKKYDSAEESAGFSAHIETLTQAIVDCMDTLKQDEVQRDRGSSEMDALENAAEQLSHLQLNKIKAHTEEEETFSPQRAIMHLKSKLHEAQMENDALTDLRLKDSRKQVSQMAKMLHLLEELQKVKMSKVWKLPETEEEAFALQREVESLAKCVRRVYHILYEKQFGDNSAGNKTVKHQEPQSGYENVHKETDKQHWTYFRVSIKTQSKDQQRNSEYEGLNNQESCETVSAFHCPRMENLIASLDQEVAMFTDKSKHRLCNKLRLLKNLAESQTSVQLCQISELELTVSSYRDKVKNQIMMLLFKVSYLEKKMLETETELFATHKERDQSLQQVKELQSQLQLLKTWPLFSCIGCLLLLLLCEWHQNKSESTNEYYFLLLGCLEEFHLKMLESVIVIRQRIYSNVNGNSFTQSVCEKQQLEFREDMKTLRGHLESTRKQLFRAGEEKSCLQMLTEQRSQEVRKLQELLQEKDKECHLLFLICHSVQVYSQHLAELAQQKSEVVRLDRERRELQNSLTDQNQHLHQETLDKQQAVKQMELQRLQLFNLNSRLKILNNFLLKLYHLWFKLHLYLLIFVNRIKERVNLHYYGTINILPENNLKSFILQLVLYLTQLLLERSAIARSLDVSRVFVGAISEQLENLQRLHSCKNEEHEGVVLQLQSQLGSAHDELHKIRRSLRTLKAADGHGLQVALDMQKEITAKREKIDAMQSRIQHLEEKVEKLQQEKRRLNLEAHHQLQDLTFAREEKRQLGSELKALRSKDHQLRERIVELEGILHKMFLKMCESLANCQDFLQLREQEHFRLKLQHALNLKELQVGSLCTCSAPSDLNCRTRSVQSAPPSPRLSFNTQIK